MSVLAVVGERGVEQGAVAREAGAGVGEGRGTVAPLADRIDAARIIGTAMLQSAEHGHSWTQGQRDATRDLLLSPHAVTGIQGSAGTAKTTTVLSTYARAARDRGFEVRALAPTATAAAVLGKAIGTDHMTVARMLATTSTIACGEKKPEVWVVDEASMLGARDAEALLVQARAQGARLVLVGDVDQLGSVEAGRAFGQLQEHGMATFRLEEIVRQSNPQTRKAVEAMLDGDAKAAFEALDAGGGRVEAVDTERGHGATRTRARQGPRLAARPLGRRPGRGLRRGRAGVQGRRRGAIHPQQLSGRAVQRADRRSGRDNPTGSSMVVARGGGRRDMLDLAHLADRHVRSGWVRTIHSS